MNKELSIPSSPTSGSEAQTFLERNGDDTENGTFRTFRNPCSQGCLSEVTDVSPPHRRSLWEKGRQRGAGERGAGVGAPPGRVCVVPAPPPAMATPPSPSSPGTFPGMRRVHRRGEPEAGLHVKTENGEGAPHQTIPPGSLSSSLSSSPGCFNVGGAVPGPWGLSPGSSVCC